MESAPTSDVPPCTAPSFCSLGGLGRTTQGQLVTPETRGLLTLMSQVETTTPMSRPSFRLPPSEEDGMYREIDGRPCPRLLSGLGPDGGAPQTSRRDVGDG